MKSFLKNFVIFNFFMAISLTLSAQDFTLRNSSRDIHYWGIAQSSSIIYIPNLMKVDEQIAFLKKLFFPQELENTNARNLFMSFARNNIDLLYGPFIEGLKNLSADVWRLVYDSSKNLDEKFHEDLEIMLFEDKLPQIVREVSSVMYFRFKNSLSPVLATDKERTAYRAKTFLEKNQKAIERLQEIINDLYKNEIAGMKEKAVRGLLNEYLFPPEFFSHPDAKSKKEEANTWMSLAPVNNSERGNEEAEEKIESPEEKTLKMAKLFSRALSFENIETIFFLIKNLKVDFLDSAHWGHLHALALEYKKKKNYSLGPNELKKLKESLFSFMLENQVKYLRLFQKLKIINTGMGPRLSPNRWLALNDWRRELAKLQADAERIFAKGGLFEKKLQKNDLNLDELEEVRRLAKLDFFSQGEYSQIHEAFSLLYGRELWDFFMNESLRANIVMPDLIIDNSGSVIELSDTLKLKMKSDKSSGQAMSAQAISTMMELIENTCKEKQ